jgi:chaperonin cofactor prefoldin
MTDDYSKLYEQLEQLNPTEREKLLSELSPSITVIFGGQNLVTHGAAIQINAKDADDVSSSLDKIPQEALGEFVKAIGTYIIKKGC